MIVPTWQAFCPRAWAGDLEAPQAKCPADARTSVEAATEKRRARELALPKRGAGVNLATQS
jgi:hypothetical protein